MKILHVVDQINQNTGGGASRVPYQLAAIQAKQGHDVTIFTSDYNLNGQIAPDGVTLVSFKTMFSWHSLRITPSMMVWMPQISFDIVHLHNYRTFQNVIAGRFAAMRKIPYILQAHGSCIHIGGSWLNRRVHQSIWYGCIFRDARRYIADAPEEINQYVAEGAAPEEIKIIPVGINTAEFASLPPKTTDRPTVLYLGRITISKGVDLLIQAFARLPQDYQLIIAGPDYGFEDDARELADDLGINDRVSFPGIADDEMRLQLYANASVFVLPSRYETWGLSFMEALACGVPVVMSDVCGAAKELPEYCGNVTSLDVDAIAEAISITVELEQNNEECKQWVAQYDWTMIEPKIERLYKDVRNDY